MKQKKIIIYYIFWVLLAFSNNLYAAKANTTELITSQQNLYDQKPWSVLYYYGVTETDPLIRLLVGSFDRWPEEIHSLELTRTLDEDNFLRQLVHPLVGVVQIAGNFTVRHGRYQSTIYELDPYVAFRWTNFPWNSYVTTSLAVGEGISYTTAIPAAERRYSENSKRLLNYLMFEATFAHPSYPQWQLVARVHHRSGAYGLYRAGNTGSNDVGLGIRYLFD